MVTGQKWSSRLTQESVRTEASPLSPYHNDNEAHPVILKEWRRNERRLTDWLRVPSTHEASFFHFAIIEKFPPIIFK